MNTHKQIAANCIIAAQEEHQKPYGNKVPGSLFLMLLAIFNVLMYIAESLAKGSD